MPGNHLDATCANCGYQTIVMVGSPLPVDGVYQSYIVAHEPELQELVSMEREHAKSKNLTYYDLPFPKQGVECPKCGKEELGFVVVGFWD